MPLKIILKPKEKMIIDGAVVKNAGSTAHLLIENDVPILREKDIITESDAQSPCRQIYFTIQLMYIDEQHIDAYYKTYWKLVETVVNGMPTVVGFVDQMSEAIISRKYYQALKMAKRLIDYEEEVLSNVRKSVANL